MRYEINGPACGTQITQANICRTCWLSSLIEFSFADRLAGLSLARLCPLPAGLAAEGLLLARGGRRQPLLVFGVPQGPRRPTFVREVKEKTEGIRGEEALQANCRNSTSLS
jgi:hypothetical protein